MRKTALAAALAAMMLPGAAMAGGYGPGQQSALHLSGVKLQFHFSDHPKQRFHGKHHRPRARGHKRFIVPHHPGHRHGFVGRPDHRPKFFHRGFAGPKVWYYKPGRRDHFKPWRFKSFKRHDHGHFGRRDFKPRGFKDRSFKHRGFKDRSFKHRTKNRGLRHRDFNHRGRRHWRQ